MNNIKKFLSGNNAVTANISELILIVVILILSSVIAIYALGGSEKITNAKIVVVTVDRISADKIEVGLFGGSDADKVLFLNVSVNGKYYNDSMGWSDTEINTFGGDGINPLLSGQRVITKEMSGSPITGGGDHVIAIARFTDGTRQIVLNAYV